MRLSWNEIRVRAKAFSEEWSEAAYEKGETQSFYNDFFEVFGVKRRQVGRYEEAVKDLKGLPQGLYNDLINFDVIIRTNQKHLSRKHWPKQQQSGPK